MGFFKDAIDVLTFDMLDLNESKQEGFNRAEDIMSGAQNRFIKLEEEKWRVAESLIAEGKPMRDALNEAGLAALPQLSEFAAGAPGTGPGFEIPLAEGTKSIASNLATYGLTDSSVMGEATGKLTSDLLSKDRRDRMNVGLSLLGQAPKTTGQGLNLLTNVQTGDPVAGGAAELQLNRPQGTFADIGNTLWTLGGYAGLKGMGFGA